VVAPSSVIAASDVVGAFGRGVNVERGRPVSGVRSCRGVDVDSRCPAWSRQLDVRPSVRDQNTQKEFISMVYTFQTASSEQPPSGSVPGVGRGESAGERHARR